jgi:hypothetical protein
MFGGRDLGFRVLRDAGAMFCGRELGFSVFPFFIRLRERACLCERKENSEAVCLIGDGELGCSRGGAEEFHIGGAASSSSAVAASTATSNVSAIGHLRLSGRCAKLLSLNLVVGVAFVCVCLLRTFVLRIQGLPFFNLRVRAQL